MSIFEEDTSSHCKADAKIAALDSLSKELSFPVNFSASSEILRQFLAAALNDNSPAIVGKTISIITVFLAQLTRNEESLSAGVREYLFQVSTVKRRYLEECVTIFRRLFELSGNETTKFLALALTNSLNPRLSEFAIGLMKRLFSRLPEGWSIESYRKPIIEALIETWQNKARPVLLRQQSLELFVNLFMIYSFRIVPEMPPIVDRTLKSQLIEALNEKGASLNLINEINQSQLLYEYGVVCEEGQKKEPEKKEIKTSSAKEVVKNDQISIDLKLEAQRRRTSNTRSDTQKQDNLLQSSEPGKLIIQDIPNICRLRKREVIKQKVISEDPEEQEQNTVNSLIAKLESFKDLSRRDQIAIPQLLEIILQNQIEGEKQENHSHGRNNQKSKPLSKSSLDKLISCIIPLISNFYTITIPSSYAATTNIVKYLIKLLPRHSIQKIIDLEQKDDIQINNTYVFYEEHLENIMISAEKASSTGSSSLRASVIRLFDLVSELFPEFWLRVIFKILSNRSSSALEISLRTLRQFLISGYFKERQVQLKMILEIFSTYASYKESSQHIQWSALNFLCTIAQITGEGILKPYLNKLSVQQLRTFQHYVQGAREEQFKNNKKMTEQENAKVKEITAMLQTDKQIYDLERLLMKNLKSNQENQILENSSQTKKSDTRMDEFVDMIRKQIEFHRCGSRRNEWWIDYVEVFKSLLENKMTSTGSLLLLSALVSSFSCAQLLKLFNIVIQLSDNIDANYNKSFLSTRFISECFRIRGVSLFFSQFQSIWSKSNLYTQCRDQGVVILIQALTISYSYIEEYLVEELSSQMIKILCQDQYLINNAIYIFLATAEMNHNEGPFLEKLADALYFHPPHLLKKVGAEKHKAMCIMELRKQIKEGTEVESIAQYDLFNESHSESDNQRIMDFMDDHESERMSTKSIADNYSFIENDDEI